MEHRATGHRVEQVSYDGALDVTRHDSQSLESRSSSCLCNTVSSCISPDPPEISPNPGGHSHVSYTSWTYNPWKLRFETTCSCGVSGSVSQCAIDNIEPWDHPGKRSVPTQWKTPREIPVTGGVL